MANNNAALGKFPILNQSLPGDYLISYSPTANAGNPLDVKVPIANLFSNITLFVRNLYVNNDLSFGNSTSNVVINATGIIVDGTPFAFSNSNVFGTNNQIIFNSSGTMSGDANLNWYLSNGTLIIGNSTVNSSINSTTYNGTVLLSNNTLFIGSTPASNVVNTTLLTSFLALFAQLALLPSIIGNNTSNSTNFFGGLSAADYANTSTPIVNTSLQIGQFSTSEILSNTTTIYIGNSTANAIINSTVYTGESLSTNTANFIGSLSAANVISNAQLTANLTNYQTLAGLAANVVTVTANDTLFVGTISAANIVSNAQLIGNLSNYTTTVNLPTIIAENTANNSTNFAGQGQAFYANVTSPIITTTLEVGAISNNVTVNTTAILIGNSTIHNSINSTSYSGIANNVLFVGTVAQANVISNAQLIANLAGYANITSPVFSISANIGSVSVNTSAISIGNDVNLGLGNVQVLFPGNSGPANAYVVVGNTIGNQAVMDPYGIYGGDLTFGNSAFLLAMNFITNVPVLYLQANTNYGVTINSGAAAIYSYDVISNNFNTITPKNLILSSNIFTTNISSNNILTPTLSIGNSTSNSTVNSTTISINNANLQTITANGSLGSNGNALLSGGPGGNVFWGTVSTGNGGTGGPIGANTQISFNLSGTESGDANLTWNFTTSSLNITNTVILGNSTVNSSVNSTVYTGTANNSTNLGGLAAASYANTSAPVITTTLEVGNTTTNILANTSSISLGNSAVNATINSTIYTGTSFGALNASLFNGQLGSFYTNATNISTGTLAWTQAPTGTINTSGNFAISGLHSFVANVSVNGAIIANGNTGTLGQILTSGGSGNVYWTSTGASVFGTNTQISFNNSGTESGDANLTWTAPSTLFTVGNSSVNVQVNSIGVTIGGATVNASTILISNAILTRVTANSSLGTAGQVLASGGPTGNLYWSNGGGTGTGGPYGTNTQIAYNNSNTEAGDANLTWTNITATLAVSNSLVLGNSTVNSSVNSTIYSGTSNNALNLGGLSAASYANNSSPLFSANISIGSNVSINTSVISVGNSTVNTTMNSNSVFIGNSNIILIVMPQQFLLMGA